MMRAALMISLMLTLGGCYSIRHRNDVEGAAATPGTTAAAAPASASADATANSTPPATEGKPKKSKSKKAAKEVLPPGLGGDKEHRAYTGDIPK